MVFPTLYQLLYEIWNDNKKGWRHQLTHVEKSYYMLADANTSGALGAGFQMKSSRQSAL